MCVRWGWVGGWVSGWVGEVRVMNACGGGQSLRELTAKGYYGLVTEEVRIRVCVCVCVCARACACVALSLTGVEPGALARV